MTREEAIENLQRLQNLLSNDPYINTQTIITTCNVAIEALKQEPCDDAISRQAAIDALLEWGTRQERIGRRSVLMCELKQTCADILNDLPSVTPKQRAGHWIECEDEVKCFCSECKEISDYPTKFCPNCGAKMAQESEGSE